MNKNDFEGFEDFNNFEAAPTDIVNPYEYDKKVSGGASRVKAVAVASAGFVIFGALVSGGAFAMTGTLPNVLPSAPGAVSVDPSAAPTDSATPSDTATPSDSATPSDTAVPTDTPTATDPVTPVVTPSLPAFNSGDEGDDQNDDNADDQSGEGSDD